MPLAAVNLALVRYHIVPGVWECACAHLCGDPWYASICYAPDAARGLQVGLVRVYVPLCVSICVCVPVYLCVCLCVLCRCVWVCVSGYVCLGMCVCMCMRVWACVCSHQEP